MYRVKADVSPVVSVFLNPKFWFVFYIRSEEM